MVIFWPRWNGNGFLARYHRRRWFFNGFFTSEPLLSMVFQWFFTFQPLVSMVFPMVFIVEPLPLNEWFSRHHWHRWFFNGFGESEWWSPNRSKTCSYWYPKIYPILSWNFIDHGRQIHRTRIQFQTFYNVDGKIVLQTQELFALWLLPLQNLKGFHTHQSGVSILRY